MAFYRRFHGTHAFAQQGTYLSAQISIYLRHIHYYYKIHVFTENDLNDAKTYKVKTEDYFIPSLILYTLLPPESQS